jgi:phage terminase Nu1 subunit (DNA packaging protein)
VKRPKAEKEEKSGAKVPTKVDVGTLAAILGVDARRVQQLKHENVVVSAGRGSYDLVASVQGYIKFWRDRAEGRAREESKDPKRGDWITRKVAGEAEKLELANAEKRRTMVHVSFMRDQWHNGVQLIRNALMSLPGRAAQPLGACENATERELLLEGEVRRTLEALQAVGSDPNFDDEDEGAVA